MPKMSSPAGPRMRKQMLYWCPLSHHFSFILAFSKWFWHGKLCQNAHILMPVVTGVRNLEVQQPWCQKIKPYWKHWLYSVSQKSDPLNVWLWQVQTCTALHIIKRAQALMYCDYCHQILYKSVVPFSRFSIFTKRCRKVQLPAALLACFPCALTIFYVNV